MSIQAHFEAIETFIAQLFQDQGIMIERHFLTKETNNKTFVIRQREDKRSVDTSQHIFIQRQVEIDYVGGTADEIVNVMDVLSQSIYQEKTLPLNVQSNPSRERSIKMESFHFYKPEQVDFIWTELDAENKPVEKKISKLKCTGILAFTDRVPLIELSSEKINHLFINNTLTASNPDEHHEES
ncbi:hypothetical protein VQL36_15955 [Chengkuizengella sp. SCS-71B]|uniref:hypothetical protein n=1 Tax=Chengkuizengella sp. SCS-71B TaxID=3115290 RepID=UPI0032C23A04